MSQTLNLVSPYTPREWARPLHAVDNRYMVLVVHRFAGKSHFAINHLIMKALQNTKPLSKYAYVSPYKSQCKRNTWSEFRHYLNHIPSSKIYFNEAELRIVLPNGATIYLLGADDPDSLRGVHLDGAVMDEVAQMPSTTWSEILYPALQSKNGWGLFIGTPKGKNLFYDLFMKHTHEDELIRRDWKSELKTVDDTKVLTDEQIKVHLLNIGEDAFQQEFMCSWTAAIKGTYYGRTLEQMAANGHITQDLYDSTLPVITAWDLGNSDSTSIWFAQIKEGNVNIIDFFEDNNEPNLEHYIEVMKSKGYKYECTLLPHDSAHRIIGMAQTRFQQIKAAGLKPKLVPKMGIMDGINAVRSLLPKCYFDLNKVDYGLKCLTHYRAKYNERMSVLMATAVHDWSSHAADAFRYLALGLKDPKLMNNDLIIKSDYNPFKPNEPKTYTDYDIYSL